MIHIEMSIWMQSCAQVFVGKQHWVELGPEHFPPGNNYLLLQSGYPALPDRYTLSQYLVLYELLIKAHRWCWQPCDTRRFKLSALAEPAQQQFKMFLKIELIMSISKGVNTQIFINSMLKSSLYSSSLQCQTQNYNIDILYLFTRPLRGSRSLILIVRTTISLTPAEKMIFTHYVMIP